MLSAEATTVRTSTPRVGDRPRRRHRTMSAKLGRFGVVATVLTATALACGCGTSTDTAAPAGAAASLTAAGPGAPTPGTDAAAPRTDRTTTGRTNTAHRSPGATTASKAAKAAGAGATATGATGAGSAAAGGDTTSGTTGAPDGGLPAGGDAGAGTTTTGAGGTTASSLSRKAVARSTVGGTGSQVDAEAATTVVGLVNAARKSAGCPALVANKVLAAVALAHSQDMARARYFEHQSPDGRTPFDRMKKAGYVYGNAAENIAAGQQTAAEVMNSWMHSPGHRANILDCALTQIGVGVYRDAASPYRVYWTQDFGTPA